MPFKSNESVLTLIRLDYSVGTWAIRSYKVAQFQWAVEIFRLSWKISVDSYTNFHWYDAESLQPFVCFGGCDAGSAGDVLEDDPVGRLKVFVYELPSKYNKKILQKDPRCLNHMFAAEIYMHRFLLSSPVRTLNPEEADWFYTPVYTTCDLTPNGLPLPFKSPRMMRSAIQLISSNWPYWNRTEGADHFFLVPHDFGACFHYQVRELSFWLS